MKAAETAKRHFNLEDLIDDQRIEYKLTFARNQGLKLNLHGHDLTTREGLRDANQAFFSNFPEEALDDTRLLGALYGSIKTVCRFGPTLEQFGVFSERPRSQKQWERSFCDNERQLEIQCLEFIPAFCETLIRETNWRYMMWSVYNRYGIFGEFTHLLEDFIGSERKLPTHHDFLQLGSYDFGMITGFFTNTARFTYKFGFPETRELLACALEFLDCGAQIGHRASDYFFDCMEALPGIREIPADDIPPFPKKTKKSIGMRYLEEELYSGTGRKIPDEPERLCIFDDRARFRDICNAARNLGYGDKTRFLRDFHHIKARIAKYPNILEHIRKNHFDNFQALYLTMAYLVIARPEDELPIQEKYLEGLSELIGKGIQLYPIEIAAWDPLALPKDHQFYLTEYVEKYGKSGSKFLAIQHSHLDYRGSSTDFRFVDYLHEHHKKERFKTELKEVDYVPQDKNEKEATARKALGLIDLLSRDRIRKRTGQKIKDKKNVSTGLMMQYGISAEGLEDILNREPLGHMLATGQYNSPHPTLSMLHGKARTDATVLNNANLPKDVGLLECAHAACAELNELLQNNGFCDEVKDLVARYQAELAPSAQFSHVKIEFNDCFFDNIINRMGNYCIFNGRDHTLASLLYTADRNAHLLCMNSYQDKRIVDSIGMAILIDAEDQQHRKYLVVEGVLGGVDLNRITKKGNHDPVWSMFYEAILKYARQKKLKTIIVNASHSDNQESPNDFLRYVADEQNRARDDESSITYSYEHIKKGNKRFTLHRPKDAIEFQGEWFTHQIQKKIMDGRVIDMFHKDGFKDSVKYCGELYSDTWWLYNKVLGREKPQWNDCTGYVRGIEIDVEEECRRLGL
jgi:hypothetical protein